MADQRTLYVARKDDPRERAAQPHMAARGRSPKTAERTSDVRRFRGVLPAAIAGATSAVIAAFVWPPPGGHGAPGPLSAPHANAGLTCGSCHKADDPKAARQACTTCHGTHGSARGGHAKMIAGGRMTCATCHPIHKGDQGVTFVPGEGAVRFAPGRSIPLEGSSFVPSRKTTVPIVTVGPCRACHKADDARDPIARCLAPGTESLGDQRPILCFDEHEIALPDDGGSAPEPRDRLRTPRTPTPRNNRPDGGNGVCAGQHTTDRAIAWDAAREVALAVPVVPGGGVGDRGWWWLVAGLAAFGLVGVGVRFAAFLPAFLAERAKRRATTPQVTAPSRVRLPTINTTTCIGCYACVDACPYNVLEIERYVAVVARPEACCGLTLCEQRCPNGSLKITEGEPIGERPGVNDDLESQEVPGLFLAGDITGLPLIKNAILQGAHAMSKIADRLKKGRNGDPNLLDAIVIGAGPAGISAALRAKEEGVSCEVIEQGNVAQSIRSFPRGKLVFDQPLDLPVTGKLWMKESTKEELLGHWLRIVRQEKLVIREETRMTRVTRTPEGTFVVTTEPTEGGGATGHGAEGRAAVPEPHCATERRCRFVVIAVGQRGSPRRLPVELPPEIEARVHYHLADAKSFAEQRVIVVGLGDVAMETAIALARQPGTTVTIVHRGDDFRRGQGRNIQSVRRLVGDGKIALVFRAEVTGFSGQAMTVEIRGGGAPRTEVLPFDAVFVMIGSIPPKATLKSAGIRTVAEAEAGTFPTLVSPRR